MPRKLTAALLLYAIAACSSIGPGTVPHDRIDYGTSIGNSWKEQTLLNIVKLRCANVMKKMDAANLSHWSDW
jgi:hypothetical protein